MAKMLQCSVVTPDRILIETEAKTVIVAGHDHGEIGFLHGHAPYIGVLGIGILRMDTNEGSLRFGVYGGFVQVDKNQVTILANRAETAEDVTDDSLAEDRARLEELSSGTDEGYGEKQALARKIRVREKLRAS